MEDTKHELAVDEERWRHAKADTVEAERTLKSGGCSIVYASLLLFAW